MDSTLWLRALLFTSLAACPSGPLNKPNCTTDVDCDQGRICVDIGARAGLDDPLLQCIQSACTSDDDCEGTCKQLTWSDGCSIRAVDQCSSADDLCSTDDDCEGGLACIPDDFGTGALACLEPINCAIGRPLSTPAHGSLTAALCSRSDWLPDDDVPAATLVAASVPAAVVEHWCRVAALEHASVGSFARFTLELLALGAPPDLLADAQRASADEIRHASAIYGWIHTLTSEALGPDELDVRRIDIASDPAVVFERLVVEGCVGESIGAALARSDAHAAADPRLRAILLGIADDEAKHAALAWRTAAWMSARWPSLKQGLGEQVRHAVAALQAIERPEGCAEHGVIDTRAARQLVGTVEREVIEPLVAALSQGVTGSTEATRTITT